MSRLPGPTAADGRGAACRSQPGHKRRDLGDGGLGDRRSLRRDTTNRTAALPGAYAAWIDKQEAGITNIDGASRQTTAHDLVARMRQVKIASPLGLNCWSMMPVRAGLSPR